MQKGAGNWIEANDLEGGIAASTCESEKGLDIVTDFNA